MKIFLIIPTLKQGGAERVMSELANQFAQKDNLKVHLVLLAKSNDFYKVDDTVIIHRLGFENKSKLNKIFSELATFKNLRKLLKTHKPDAVLSFMEKYNSFTILAAAFLGLQVFVSDRSNPLKKVPQTTEILRKFTYKYATGIIAQTQFAKDVLAAKTKNKNIRVIPNPVKEIQNYPDIAKEKLILNVGRLVPEKGQKYLIEAFSKINEKADWRVVILGDGPLRSELEEQVNALGLSNQVLLLGAVNNVDEWLAKASIFVFPSISEGFPNALAEAMSAGLPCVSFDCKTGPRDLIENYKNGILVEEKNVEELANSLQKLIDDPILRLRLGTQAIVIKEHLSSDKIAKCFYEFMMK